MTIIRPRNQRQDTKEILRLIRTELIPRSHTVREGDPQVLRELPKRLRQGQTFVAARSRSSLPLGFVHLVPSGEQLLIDMLVVHPREQGRSLGKQLMLRAEQHGLSSGCTFARLFVDEDNIRAGRFYERLGYVTTSYLSDYRCFELHKRLV
ncbi:GNAT family N-acetyltransferase [Paenibacillus sp. 1P07SE]|uniref:GNAT family N-acetyltransferase n=1 Tax=Paenibacillus sp. 1P07SE TaxID=3132209 RepID=UPI0039A46E51